MSTDALPPTHRALRQTTYGEAPSVMTVPTPQPTPGSAIVRVQLASILNYTKYIYNGRREYPYPVPLTLGNGAIGRIAALGPDATTLKVGDLVLLDVTIRSRDNTDSAAGDTFLSAIHEGFTAGSQKLMRDVWRDGTYAEFVRWPLENCFVLNEQTLLAVDGRGYDASHLMYIPRLQVPYGGLGPSCIDLKPGETVIVAPATGSFGSAAVHLCLELGAARVIAMGRNIDILRKLQSTVTYPARLSTVPLTGDWEADLAALKALNVPIDVYFDISPPAAAGSGHLKAGIMALRHGGRVCLMGGLRGDVPIPHSQVMHGNVTIKGKWMYEPSDVRRLVTLVETGIVRLHSDEAGITPLGAGVHEKYALDKWEAAFDAAEQVGSDGIVLFAP